MSEEILIEGKVVGQKRALFADWRIPIPHVEERDDQQIKLRGLIAQIVREEVKAFRQRQEERRLARILTPGEIERSLSKGKVDLGERDLAQEVDEDSAISVALQAFEDGLYYVFVDGVQQDDLDKHVYLRPNSRVTFVRLVALAGG